MSSWAFRCLPLAYHCLSYHSPLSFRGLSPPFLDFSLRANSPCQRSPPCVQMRCLSSGGLTISNSIALTPPGPFTHRQELVEIFPDEFIHFGGDEVQIECYNSSAKVRAFMVEKGWDTTCPRGGGESSGHCVGYKHLVAYFLRTVQVIARKHGRTPSGWQEIFDHYGGNTTETPTVRRLLRDGHSLNTPGNLDRPPPSF